MSRDLIFTTKIKGTATELGYAMLVANTQSQAESMIATYRPPVVLVDLTAGEMAESAALRAYKALAGANSWLIAFGPHVDLDTLAAARPSAFKSFCPAAPSRSRLAEFLRQIFQSSAGEK